MAPRAIVPARSDADVIYRELLVHIVGAFQSGTAPLSAQQLSEPVAFIGAALRSSKEGGAEIPTDADE